MKYILMLISSLFFASPLFAHEYKLGDIKIDHPWAKASRAGQKSGGGFFVNITNLGQDDKLIRASSSISRLVELHSMSIGSDQVMRMAEVPSIPIPHQQEINIKPGAYHIMFIDLHQPLIEGSKFPVTLEFEKAGKIELEFSVENVDFSPKDSSHTTQGHGSH